MVFENHAGIKEDCSAPWLWCFLFGSLYFLFKGIWTHAIIYFIVAMLTGGVSMFIYPFFANAAVEHHYTHKGWKRLS